MLHMLNIELSRSSSLPRCTAAAATPSIASAKHRSVKPRLMFASARRLLSVGVPAAAASVLASNRASCDESRLAALERRVAALEQPARANSRSDGVASSWAKAVLSPDVLFSERDLETMIDSLAAQISRDYGDGEDLVVVGLLDGVFMFLADLSRKIDTPHTVDFIAASSYGLGTVSSGNVKIKKDSSFPLAGKHVLIVDEMCDSGRTMASLKELMKQRQVKSVKTCVLLDKVSRRTEDIRPDYVGAVCPDEFVVGYGMDWGGKYRSLPFVGVVRKELYS